VIEIWEEIETADYNKTAAALMLGMEIEAAKSE